MDRREAYLQWLCARVDAGGDLPEDSYMMLMRELHKRIFVSAVPNDDNRASDGLGLRELYGWGDASPCSVLEMLVALADRMAYQMADYETYGDLTSVQYFWCLIRNLGLEGYTDAEMLEPWASAKVHGIIDRLLDRTYASDGTGGLFPLEEPKEDQRKVEIWYQMQAYLMEKYTGND